MLKDVYKDKSCAYCKHRVEDYRDCFLPRQNPVDYNFKPIQVTSPEQTCSKLDVQLYYTIDGEIQRYEDDNNDKCFENRG